MVNNCESQKVLFQVLELKCKILKRSKWGFSLWAMITYALPIGLSCKPTLINIFWVHNPISFWQVYILKFEFSSYTWFQMSSRSTKRVILQMKWAPKMLRHFQPCICIYRLNMVRSNRESLNLFFQVSKLELRPRSLKKWEWGSYILFTWSHRSSSLCWHISSICPISLWHAYFWYPFIATSLSTNIQVSGWEKLVLNGQF